MMWNNGYGIMGIGVWIIGLIFLIIIIAIVLFVFFSFRNNISFFGSSGHETPLEILKRRYAKGEISKEEFEKIKKDIEN